MARSSETYAVPAWFKQLLKWYKEKKGDTFTKAQLRAYARSIGCAAADETISRYVRYAVKAGLVEKLKKRTRTGAAIYRIVGV